MKKTKHRSLNKHQHKTFE